MTVVRRRARAEAPAAPPSPTAERGRAALRRPARQRFFATTAKGLEALLAEELRALGAEDVEATRAGASFAGRLEIGYRACLWSRVASRILLPIASFRAETPEALYEGVASIRWRDHVSGHGTIAVDCSTSQSRLTHSHYAALKTKDAIVDQMRQGGGQRPSVDVVRPDVRVNVYIHRDRASVAIDMSGDSLHRRGYRERGVAAPLKENLAAGLLLLAEWPRLAAEGAPLLDPMCGSGTLPIEAALIAGDVAPGLRRPHFGFLGWGGHDEGLWRRLVEEAKGRAGAGLASLPSIRGSDVHGGAVRSALANVERAGLLGRIRIERRPLAECAPLAGSRPGVFITNPPYGERIGDLERLALLYAEIGDVLRRRFIGWTGYVLCGNPELAKTIGLRAARRFEVYNGAIECRLLKFPIAARAVETEQGPRWRRK